ncbi:XRE family transcriptional regulator [Chromobacterium sp. TRC.1.1.SA]|uniref:XRE family transcriptional regulator n=1 Tax=Chromobacterium indicum TaxID=3110228 RepID=A0ABV0CMJ7_9NEIS
MTKGIKDLQPARLEQALSARGLTKGQLASLVGVAASTVTKWCKGDQFPEAEAFDRLALVLNVQAEWLARPMLPPVTPPLYRSNANALKSARAKLEAHTEWAQEIALLLSNYVDYPKLNIPKRSFIDPEQISSADIEAAAEECRALWQLGKGPIQNLVLAAEGAGVLVIRQETEISVIEGLSAWSQPLGCPIILLAADKANGFRSRFDLAHEIGHLVLHKHIPKTDDKERYNLMEKQAHRFAGALLLPAETFANEVRIPSNLDNLLILKQRWGVSVAAMMMRLHALGLLSDDERLLLFKRRSARWGSKAEPGDDQWEPELPRLLRRTIELLINEGVLSVDNIPRYLGISPRDVEKLCHLRENYFDSPVAVIELAALRAEKYQSQLSRLSGDKAPVVPLQRLKK